MMPEEVLAYQSYSQLVAQMRELGKEIDVYRDMSSEEEQAFRRAYSDGGSPPPEDFRSIFIVEAGKRQVEIVRECLKRVDLGRLARDTRYPATSLMLFASYRGDPPDPTAN